VTVFVGGDGRPLSRGVVEIKDAYGQVCQTFTLNDDGALQHPAFIRLAAGRTHTVKRGETLHGIAKRLSGSSDPSEIAGYTQALARANGNLPAGLVKEGAVLTVPQHFPDRPSVGWEHGSSQDMALRFQHKTEIADDAERLFAELMTTHENLSEARSLLRKAAVLLAIYSVALIGYVVWTLSR